MPFTNGRHARRPDANGRPTHVSDAAPAARSSLRRSSPCHGHPLGQGKSDQTPAGLLAHGSSLDARPSQASHDLASGPVAGGSGRYARPHMYIALATYSCRDSRGIGWMHPSAPHSLLRPLTRPPARSLSPIPAGAFRKDAQPICQMQADRKRHGYGQSKGAECLKPPATVERQGDTGKRRDIYSQ